MKIGNQKKAKDLPIRFHVLCVPLILPIMFQKRASLSSQRPAPRRCCSAPSSPFSNLPLLVSPILSHQFLIMSSFNTISMNFTFPLDLSSSLQLSPNYLSRSVSANDSHRFCSKSCVPSWWAEIIRGCRFRRSIR